MRNLLSREYEFETDHSAEAIHCRMALVTDQQWYRGRYLHEQLRISRGATRFAGQVRPTGFEVRPFRVIGSHLAGPRANGEVLARAGRTTQIRVRVTYYPELLIFAAVMVALPVMFVKVFGLYGGVVASSLLLPIQLLLAGLALRSEARRLLRSLEETLELHKSATPIVIWELPESGCWFLPPPACFLQPAY
jgi:hypothetical protein